MLIKRGFFLAVLLFSALLIHSQENRAAVIRSLAESGDQDQKAAALRNINDLMKDNALSGDEEEYVRILSYLSGEGVTNIKTEHGAVINDFPAVRRDAVLLLGELGGPAARSALISVMRYDHDPYVLAEAAFALAKTGPDDEGKMISVFYLTLAGKKAVYDNDRVVQAVIRAIETISAATPSILEDPRIVEGLIFAAKPQLGYSRETRNLAEELLNRSTSR